MTLMTTRDVPARESNKISMPSVTSVRDIHRISRSLSLSLSLSLCRVRVRAKADNDNAARLFSRGRERVNLFQLSSELIPDENCSPAIWQVYRRDDLAPSSADRANLRIRGE